jgi:hypothetical protein
MSLSEETTRALEEELVRLTEARPHIEGARRRAVALEMWLVDQQDALLVLLREGEE